MPIKSYIVHPAPGKLDSLALKLASTKYCDVNPSTNKEVLVMVTDTPSVDEEKALQQKLQEIKEINNMALVSGFDM